MVGMVSLMVIYAYVSGLTRSAANLAQRETLETTTALAQAKEALIAYAVTYKDRNDDPGGGTYTVPGYLPCPEMAATASNEGVAAGTCGSALVSQLGRLPWRTLGLDALKDGSGECLWYAVSGKYKNSSVNAVSGSTATSNMMNWDNNGQFKVYDADGTTLLTGSSEDSQAVAVIFAPGRALSGQVRTVAAGSSACRGSYSAAAYLETANGINNSVVSGTASAVSNYIAGTEGSTFNDKLVYITRADIWTAIKKRTDFNNYLRALTRRTAECTAMYGTQNSAGAADRRLPWAANRSLSGTSLPTYAVNASYNDISGLTAGRLSFRVNTARGDTNNNISGAISDYGTNSAYLFTSGSYCAYTADQKIWYDHWKDHLFYAVADKYRPNASHSPMGACTNATCPRINASATYYAAIVMFAGEKLSGTNRNTAANKGSVANYLSTTNSNAILADNGAGIYQAAATSSTFNDIVYAIDTNLAVKCYDSTAMVMVSVPAAAVAPPGSPAAYAACP